jgi:hypothetical protein
VQAGAQLVFVERFAPAITLHHHRQLDLGRLQRAEALKALRALAPAPDRGAVLTHARIDHAGVIVLAERAMHAGVSWLRQP